MADPGRSGVDSRRWWTFGLLWLALPLAFEIGLGRATGMSWDRIASDFDPRRGGLLAFGMLVILVAPRFAAHGHPRQTLDLYLPTPPAVRTSQKAPATGYQTKLPLVIWIYGGAFLVGSKDDTVPLELLPQGYAVASIGYRHSSEAKFPAPVEDCKAAIRWLRANSARFALDPERFAVFGESAAGIWRGCSLAARFSKTRTKRRRPIP